MDSSLPMTTAELLATQQRLRRLARALVGDDHDADDVVQETWLRAERAGRRARSRGWLAKVTRNLGLNTRRGHARRRRREAEAAVAEPDDVPGPFDLAVFEERRRAVVAAVQRLPPAQRDLLVARYWQGLTPKEIAARLSLPRGRVRMRLSRALAALRAELGVSANDGGGNVRAWLAPLLGAVPARGPWPAPAALSAAGGLGMLAMSKIAWGWMLAFLVLTLVGVATGALLWIGTTPAPPSAAAVALGARTSASGGGGHEARATIATGVREPLADPRVTTPALVGRLVDADGAACADVRYWRDMPAEIAVPAPDGHPMWLPVRFVWLQPIAGLGWRVVDDHHQEPLPDSWPTRAPAGRSRLRVWALGSRSRSAYLPHEPVR